MSLRCDAVVKLPLKSEKDEASVPFFASNDAKKRMIYRIPKNTTMGCTISSLNTSLCWALHMPRPARAYDSPSNPTWLKNARLIAFSEPPSEGTWLKNARLIAFSEPPSEGTWLENAWLIAFSEPPSEGTWLENAQPRAAQDHRLSPQRHQFPRHLGDARAAPRGLSAPPYPD